MLQTVSRPAGRGRACAALLALLLSGGCAGASASAPAQSYQRARALLAQVDDAPELIETVHADPRVLAAIAAFLPAANLEGHTDEQLAERFKSLIPAPPWEWAPSVAFRKVQAGLYLVALGHAVSTQPSSLYLFEGSRYVRIDSGVSGTVQVEAVRVEGDLIEVAYFPTSGGTFPRLTSARIERTDGRWRVDHDTPYTRVVTLLGRVPRGEIETPDVHRHPLLLEALGVFLANADRLSDDDRQRHLSTLFPEGWYHALPVFNIRRLGPTLYLVAIESGRPDARGGSLHLFDGASHVSLASDDARSIVIEHAEVRDRRIEVTYSQAAVKAPSKLGHAVAVTDGAAWRVLPPHR